MIRNTSPAASLRLSHATAATAPPARDRRFLCLDDFERAARSRLPRMLYGFVAGGAEEQASLRDNRAAFAELRFLPRILADVSARSQATSLFGRPQAHPFGIAPMGLTGICAFEADLLLARAAAEVRIPMVLSATSIIPMEQIRAAAPDTWMQAYLPAETDRIDGFLQRVADAGFETLVLTADVPVAANREHNIRNGFDLPLRPGPRLFWQGATHPRWLLGTVLRTLARRGMPHFENMDRHRGPPVVSPAAVRALGRRDALSWVSFEFIRARWRGKLLIKGVLSPRDARIASEAGADGIIVSNHGGRQLDGAVSPLRALPAIAAEAKGLPILFDSGIRRGSDVLKALALGADFVFLGRPFLFAAAAAGAAGIRRAIAILAEEIDRDMALLGVTAPSMVTPDYLAAATPPFGGRG
ncbi:alpha-hydroxy acid oxidase [Inquilinus limosus]|uniref:alpha-hydroxy acid oxidase n=1 Tax=Inquilinus limosus TaxID=171674 RepID=UPI000690934F|nr:alpha-hydroxy acid oxidase [Inquilinus limosus]